MTYRRTTGLLRLANTKTVDPFLSVSQVEIFLKWGCKPGTDSNLFPQLMDTNPLLTMLQITNPRSSKESNMISPIGIKKLSRRVDVFSD